MGVDMDNDDGFDFSALDQLEAAALRDKASHVFVRVHTAL